MRHRIPLTKSFISGTFGAEARQLVSGESIVIVNVEETKVYKYPLLLTNRCCLYYLQNCHHTGHLACTQFLLPHAVLSANQAFFCVQTFTTTHWSCESQTYAYYVCKICAIKELHGCNIAHLDIRLENICFDAQERVVLIDLDR